MKKKAMIILAMLAVLPSCLDETVKPITEAPSSTWPAMTSEEDVVRAILWCYRNPSAEDVMIKYESILHSEYFFYLAAKDIESGGDASITRTADIDLTALLFDRQVLLELSLTSSGSWVDRREIAEAPCDGCREATRQYFIRAQFSRDGNIFQCSPSKAYVTIVVAPDEGDSSKWVIRAIYDIAM